MIYALVMPDSRQKYFDGHVQDSLPLSEPKVGSD